MCRETNQTQTVDPHKHRAVLELHKFMKLPEGEVKQHDESASAAQALGPYLDALKALGKLPLPSADLHAVRKGRRKRERRSDGATTQMALALWFFFFV